MVDTVTDRDWFDYSPRSPDALGHPGVQFSLRVNARVFFDQCKFPRRPAVIGPAGAPIASHVLRASTPRV
jgi:hypothetical protein